MPHTDSCSITTIPHGCGTHFVGARSVLRARRTAWPLLHRAPHMQAEAAVFADKASRSLTWGPALGALADAGVASGPGSNIPPTTLSSNLGCSGGLRRYCQYTHRGSESWE